MKPLKYEISSASKWRLHLSLWSLYILHILIIRVVGWEGGCGGMGGWGSPPKSHHQHPVMRPCSCVTPDRSVWLRKSASSMLIILFAAIIIFLSDKSRRLIESLAGAPVIMNAWDAVGGLCRFLDPKQLMDGWIAAAAASAPGGPPFPSSSSSWCWSSHFASPHPLGPLCSNTTTYYYF